MSFELVAKVLVVSDGVTQGRAIDSAGPKVVARLVDAGFAVIDHEVTPDGIDEVAFALRDSPPASPAWSSPPAAPGSAPAISRPKARAS